MKLPDRVSVLANHPDVAREWLSWREVLCDDDRQIFKTVGAYRNLLINIHAIARMQAIEEEYVEVKLT